MVVANTNTKEIFNGNGLTYTWPISFSLNGVTDEEILVYLTTRSTGVSILLTDNYSVDLVAATVRYPTIGSAISSDYGIVIRRKLALTQETDLINQGSLPAEDLEISLDRFAMICQQMQEQLDRTAQSDVSGSSADSEIGALLTSVSDARDEATEAAAAAALDAATVYSSMAVATAYINTLNGSFANAAAYAASAEDSADAAAGSANAAAYYAGTIIQVSVMATKSASQLIATATPTKVTWETEDFDTGDYFASSRFTPLRAGKYYISSIILFNDDVTDLKNLQVRIYKNGSEIYRNNLPSRLGIATGVPISCVVAMNGSTDYIEIYAYHDATGSFYILSQSNFSAFKVG